MIEVTVLKPRCFNLSLHMTSVKETERNIISPATETNKLNTHTSFNKAKISFNKIETKTDLKNK